MYTSETAVDEVMHHEIQVLSRTFKYPELKSQLKVEPKWFRDHRHQAIAEKIISDPDFDSERLMTAAVKDKERYGDINFAQTILNYGVASGSPNEHLSDQKFVLLKYIEREIDKAIQEYKAEPTPSNQIQLSKHIEALHQLDMGDDDQKVEVLSGIMSDLHSDEQKNIIKTGFTKLDDIIGGFERQQLNVVAARPSIGKTAFALEMGQNLSDVGANVTFISIESTVKNMTQRVLSSISKVGLYKFKEPSKLMSSEEIDRVMTAIDIFYKKEMDIVEEAKVTPNMIRKMAHNMPDDRDNFIIIDYLQLMQSDHRMKSKYEEVSDISRELKIITQEFSNLTIIALSQLSRGVEQRQDKRPMMSDLRESGQIEQDANMIMMLYRDDYYNPPDEGTVSGASPLEVIVAKNKDGDLGTAILGFSKAIQKIY
jgi:replicative DNA helicase